MADTLTVRAYAKNVDQTPRKISLVAGLVRGRTVADALVILSHTPKRAAGPLVKAIESAAANATNNHGLDVKTLSISTLSVTTGTRIKRYKPIGHGQAAPFQKKSANILVEVSGTAKPKKVAADKIEKTAKATVKEEEK